MKKILSVMVALCMVTGLFSAISTLAFTDDYGNYVIFADGEFKSGGEIIDGSGTIIADGELAGVNSNVLIGGTYLYNGEPGEGKFAIKIDDSDSDAVWKEYKYLRIIGTAYMVDENSQEPWSGGIVSFGEENTYYFNDLEITGNLMPGYSKISAYELDLKKISNFDKNILMLSGESGGYKIVGIELSNYSDYDADPITTSTPDEPIPSATTDEPVPTATVNDNNITPTDYDYVSAQSDTTDATPAIVSGTVPASSQYVENPNTDAGNAGPIGAISAFSVAIISSVAVIIIGKNKKR